MERLNNLDFDLLAKIGIVLIFVGIVAFVVYRLLKSTSIRSILKGDQYLDTSLPKLHFYGKSLSETISIHAFARVLKEKGYNWKEIKTGYRPDFLRNTETGKNLEMDAYHPTAKIGIEYNGPQHYNYPNVYHNCRRDFDKCVERDRLKMRLAQKNGIKLIEIPYYIDSCKMKKNKYINVKRSNEEREELIYKYLKSRID